VFFESRDESFRAKDHRFCPVHWLHQLGYAALVVLDGGGEGQDIGKDGVLGGRLRCGEGVEGRVGFGEAVEVVRGIGEVRDDGRVDIQIEWQGGRARADVKGLVHVPWSGWSNCTVVRNALLIRSLVSQINPSDQILNVPILVLELSTPTLHGGTCCEPRGLRTANKSTVRQN